MGKRVLASCTFWGAGVEVCGGEFHTGQFRLMCVANLPTLPLVSGGGVLKGTKMSTQLASGFCWMSALGRDPKHNFLVRNIKLCFPELVVWIMHASQHSFFGLFFSLWRIMFFLMMRTTMSCIIYCGLTMEDLKLKKKKSKQEITIPIKRSTILPF